MDTVIVPNALRLMQLSTHVHRTPNAVVVCIVFMACMQKAGQATGPGQRHNRYAARMSKSNCEL